LLCWRIFENECIYFSRKDCGEETTYWVDLSVNVAII
jgi:hypothetical protein